MAEPVNWHPAHPVSYMLQSCLKNIVITIQSVCYEPIKLSLWAKSFVLIYLFFAGYKGKVYFY